MRWQIGCQGAAFAILLFGIGQFLGSSGAPKFFTFTGEFQGTLPHFGNGDKLP